MIQEKDSEPRDKETPGLPAYTPIQRVISQHLRYLTAFSYCSLWCWRRLLRVPWIARRSSQSVLKEINPEYPLEGLMLKLKLQYFGHLTRRTDSLGKTLMLGNIEGGRERNDRGWNGWIASLTWWTWVWVSSRSWWWTGKPGVLQSTGSQRVGQDWMSELSWTEEDYPVPVAAY